MNQIYAKPERTAKEKTNTVHVKMRVIVVVGILVLISLIITLFFKFKKAMFVLAIPSTVTLLTMIGILTERHRLIWPILAISCCHIMLAAYAILIFLFYFIFKPFYIIMVLNWAFDTLHNDKTPSYYVQCSCIFCGLILFLAFNIWQASVAHNYQRHLVRRSRLASSGLTSSAPTVLVVNKPIEYASSHY